MTSMQRIGVLVLAAAAIAVAFVLLRPSDDDPAEPQRAAEATATVTPTETPGDRPASTPEPTPDPGPLLTADEVTEIEVEKGDRVRFRARSAEPEEIHVHGYDLTADVEPGRVASMSFDATIEGIFEIEFEQSGTQIAELRVDP